MCVPFLPLVPLPFYLLCPFPSICFISTFLSKCVNLSRTLLTVDCILCSVCALSLWSVPYCEPHETWPWSFGLPTDYSLLNNIQNRILLDTFLPTGLPPFHQLNELWLLKPNSLTHRYAQCVCSMSLDHNVSFDLNVCSCQRGALNLELFCRSQTLLVQTLLACF